MLRGDKKVRADCKTFLPRTAGAGSGLTHLSPLTETASLHMVTAFSSHSRRGDTITMSICGSERVIKNLNKVPELSSKLNDLKLPGDLI